VSLLTGGQALVQSLKREGVRTIFGLPGTQLDYAFDALYEEREAIRVVHTRHEQAAAYMADGYARSTGQVGVYLVVPGPGVLNTTASLSTSFANNTPVLCITGQIQSEYIGMGRGLLHEIDDQLGVLRHLTKWTARARTPGDVPFVVHEAFRQLRSGRSRPVAIEIPPDVLQQAGEVCLGEPLPPQKQAGDPDLIEKAAKLLGEAKRPLIMSGGGVLAAGAWDELRAVAEMLEAPVIMSPNGRGALSDRHHLAHTHLALLELLPEADAVLAVGTRLMQYGGHPWPIGTSRPLVRIDADPVEFTRSYRGAVPIAADARLALAELAKRIGKHNHPRASRRDELTALRQSIDAEVYGAVPHGAYGRAIREELPDDGIWVGEMTQLDYWAGSGYTVYGPRTYLNPGYQGTLGSGFPTALGVQVANPDRTVLSINGDGGFMFNAQELATAVQHDIPLITVVFDDKAYGNVRMTQLQMYNGRVIASDLRNPSFAKLAEVYGMRGLRAVGPDEFRSALRQAIDAQGPTLIEVPTEHMPWPSIFGRLYGLAEKVK
jgi:acetolactate synthase-1/2/3 large subunit